MNKTDERIIVVDMSSARRIEETEEKVLLGLDKPEPHKVPIWSSHSGRLIVRGEVTGKKYEFLCGWFDMVDPEDTKALLDRSFFSSEEP